MDSTEKNASGRGDWWWSDRLANSRAGAGVAGGILLAVVMTASIALGVTSGDEPVAAKQKPTAKADESYLTPVGTLLQDPALPRPALSGDTGTAGVPKGTSPRPTTPPKTPVKDAGRIAVYSGGAGTLTPAGIATLALTAGCSASSAVVATAVAIAESGGSPSAQGDVTLMDATWDWSAGLWQIRGLRDQRGTGQLRDSIANQDPAANAKAMYAISSGCSSWSPWTTYTRGDYQSFLAIARRAVDYVSQYSRTHGGKLPAVPPRAAGAPIPAGGGNAAAGGTSASASPAKRGTTTRPSAVRTSAAGGRTGGSSANTGGGTGNGGGSKSTPKPSRTPTPTKSGGLPTRLPTLLPTKLPTLLPTTLPALPSLGLGLP